MEEKVKHLEDAVTRYKNHLGNDTDHLNHKRGKEKMKCRKCDNMFESKKMLKDHMRVNHSKDIKCKDCENIFVEQWQFEKHLAKEHGNEKTFDCEVCDQSFYTKWRLRKHTRSHEETNGKFCHYYNNSKKCPFEEFGCKFRHADSEH